jgi:hypothetical protein
MTGFRIKIGPLSFWESLTQIVFGHTHQWYKAHFDRNKINDMLLSILEKYKPDSLRTLSLYGVDPSLKRTLISLNEIVSLHSILSLNQIAFGHFIFAIKHNDFELQ